MDAGGALRALLIATQDHARKLEQASTPIMRDCNVDTASTSESVHRPADNGQAACGGGADREALRGSADDVALLDLSLSDSEPSLSPVSAPSRHEAASPVGVEMKPAQGALRSLIVSNAGIAHASMARTASSQSLRHGSGQRLAAPPPWEWLRAMSREQRQRLRQCPTPTQARGCLAAILGPGCNGNEQSAPRKLLDDIQRHTHAAQQQVLDLEDELRKQSIYHQNQTRALEEERQKANRRMKLQLLAQYAPRQSAAREALTCEAMDQTPVPFNAAALSGTGSPGLRHRQSHGCIQGLARSCSAGSLRSERGRHGHASDRSMRSFHSSGHSFLCESEEWSPVRQEFGTGCWDRSSLPHEFGCHVTAMVDLT